MEKAGSRDSAFFEPLGCTFVLLSGGRISATVWGFMDLSTALRFFSLGILTKRRYDALVRRYGDLAHAWDRLDEELLIELRCRPDTVESAMRRKAVSVEAIQQQMQQAGIALITIEDRAYPAMLQDIPDAPVFLSYRGDLSVLKGTCIGIVGTRAMTSYGRRVTERFVSAFVDHRLTAVSGLALGIDSLVARQTIAAGGKAVAVLGSGLQQIFPLSNTRLAEEIVEGGGLLLSEFPLDMIPTKYTFPGRNRIIAALSKGVLVIEAGEQSGALITADLAMDYGRDVFAVPGSVFNPASTGCNALISKGTAHCALSPEDVLSCLGIIASSASRPLRADSYAGDTPGEKTILAILGGAPQSSSDLIEKSGLGPAEVTSALTTLELAGVAGNTMEGWVRK